MKEKCIVENCEEYGVCYTCGKCQKHHNQQVGFNDPVVKR